MQLPAEKIEDALSPLISLCSRRIGEAPPGFRVGGLREATRFPAMLKEVATGTHDLHILRIESPVGSIGEAFPMVNL